MTQKTHYVLYFLTELQDSACVFSFYLSISLIIIIIIFYI